MKRTQSQFVDILLTKRHSFLLGIELDPDTGVDLSNTNNDKK